MKTMSREVENLLTFRSLYSSPLVRIHDYRCRAGRGGPATEEYSATNNVVLMRHGAFCKHFGQKSVTADVNQAVFFSGESTYRVSHPADCGDRGTIFAPAQQVLNDIIRELNPCIDDASGRPFPFVTGPCPGDVFWRHRQLVQRLETTPAGDLDPLWADLVALRLVADVLEAAFARHGLQRRPRRNATEADHAKHVEAVKAYLASRLLERITLDEIAHAVYASPFHLARIFQKQTAQPIHRYLTRLRLRASLEALSKGATDLTTLALDFGFSSHSHFTDAFRREFGCPPSAVRCETRQGLQALREMSKNLEARSWPANLGCLHEDRPQRLL